MSQVTQGPIIQQMFLLALYELSLTADRPYYYNSISAKFIRCTADIHRTQSALFSSQIADNYK